MRRKLDAYMTPEWYVKQLLETVTPAGKIFEPCVGDGAISRFFPGCITNDIDPQRPADFHFNAGSHEGNKNAGWVDIGWPEWVITNPPFTDAYDILQCAMTYAQNIALLLRISFLEPTKEREQFLVNNPPRHLIYLPRYSFTQNGKSDSSTCLWAVWQSFGPTQTIRIAPRFPIAD